MAIFTMLIGLPASTKSTCANNQTNAIVISTDKIRAEIFGNINDQSHNGDVFDIAIKRARTALNEDKDVIFDATNLKRKHRKGILQQMPKNCTKNAIVFVAAFEGCLQRNRMRERHVPEDVMLKMLKSFEPPHKSEGFDNIYLRDVDRDCFADIDKEIQELKTIPHDNPHHSLSIGDHCIKVYEIMNDLLRQEPERFSLYEQSILQYSALFHDIGKKETKTFLNAKGEFSEVAHYYQHESVGAYKALLLLRGKPDDFRLEVANIIVLHMTFFSGEAAIIKRQKMFGESLWEKVELLHAADILGH